MKKWIEKAYRPVGFILIGAAFGSGLTLAVQGKLTTPDIVRGVGCLLGLGILVVNWRRNKTLFFLAISVLGAGNAVGLWMGGKPFGAIAFTVFALIYVGSAWAEHDRRKKKTAEEIAQSI